MNTTGVNLAKWDFLFCIFPSFSSFFYFFLGFFFGFPLLFWGFSRKFSGFPGDFSFLAFVKDLLGDDFLFFGVLT